MYPKKTIKIYWFGRENQPFQLHLDNVAPQWYVGLQPAEQQLGYNMLINTLLGYKVTIANYG